MAFYFMCVWYFPIVWRPPLYREVVFEQNIGFAKELWFNASPQLELDTASKKMYLWCTFNFKKFILHFIISNIFILHFTYTFIHFTESRTLVSGAGHTSRLADVLKGKCFWIFSLSRIEFPEKERSLLSPLNSNDQNIDRSISSNSVGGPTHV